MYLTQKLIHFLFKAMLEENDPIKKFIIKKAEFPNSI